MNHLLLLGFVAIALLLGVFATTQDELKHVDYADLNFDGSSQDSSNLLDNGSLEMVIIEALERHGIDIEKTIEVLKQLFPENGRPHYSEHQDMHEPGQKHKQLEMATKANLPSFPPRNNSLSVGCSNQYCDFLETAMSCKAFSSLHIDKTCARYLLGFMLQCPAFPAKDEIYDAPFACTVQFLTVLSQLAKIKTSATDSVANTFIGTSKVESCQRRCYQRYITQGNALFFGSCAKEMRSNATATHYAFSKAALQYSYFRNQICASSERNVTTNCFDLAYSSFSNLIGGGGGGGSLTPKQMYTCQFSFFTIEGFAPLVADALRKKLKCCFGTFVALLEQSPLTSNGAAVVNIFPPCLYHYLAVGSSQSPEGAFTPWEICPYNTNLNNTVYQFTITIKSTLSAAVNSVQKIGCKYITVFDKTTVLNLQGIMAAGIALTATGGKSTTLGAPYYLSALNFELIDYEYLDYLGQPVLALSKATTPLNATDYLNTTQTATYTFNVVVQGLSTTTSVQNLYGVISNSGNAINSVFAQKFKAGANPLYTVTSLVANAAKMKSYGYTPVTPTPASSASQNLVISVFASLFALISFVVIAM